MEEDIKPLDVPVLAEGKYLHWIMEMSQHLHKAKGLIEIGNQVDITEQPWGILSTLTEADKRYSEIYDIFLNHNYLETQHRDRMEELLARYNELVGYTILTLSYWASRVGITPSVVAEFYNKIIEDNKLTVLHGDNEPLNTALQVGHWENYIESEVGWSLRGAFSIVPPGDVLNNSSRYYIGNKISNDSVYVMRIKQWDITSKIVNLFNNPAINPVKSREEFMNIWLAVFNYLNYMNAKPYALFNTIHSVYHREISLLIKTKNESNN